MSPFESKLVQYAAARLAAVGKGGEGRAGDASALQALEAQKADLLGNVPTDAVRGLQSGRELGVAMGPVPCTCPQARQGTCAVSDGRLPS